MSVGARPSPHLRKPEARSGCSDVKELQEQVSPLARNEQDHRKDQAANARYFESQRTDDTTVRCAKPWKEEPNGIQSRRGANHQNNAGHKQRLETILPANS